jgi:hypothetical protein
MIYPASQHDFPVMWCCDRGYERMSYAMLQYRDACRALADCGGKGVRLLKAQRNEAHENLMASFFEVQS